MKSVLAVLAQIALSASNYAVFLAMARLLDEAGFVAFSTAVGLNMLAYALAEGGVSYVAPKALADRGDSSGPALAGAFMALSATLYLLAMVGGYLAWNALAAEPLQPAWVMAYGLYFFPALLMPAWLTCWSMDRSGLIGVLLLRSLMVGAVIIWPTLATLCWCGLVFFAFTAWLTARCNRPTAVLDWPDRPALHRAIGDLRKVFWARTASYAAYALLPLLVGVFRGNAAAASYVTAERLKSLYATLFQPLIQSMYLWQFQPRTSARRKQTVSVALHVLNVAACLAALWAANMGLLDVMGPRFGSLASSPLVWLAAAVSVASACLLMLHIFPAANYGLFRRAAVVQLLAFCAVGTWLVGAPTQSVVWLLFGGETALLAAIVLQMGIARAARSKSPGPS